MERAVERATLHDPSQLKSVLFTSGNWTCCGPLKNTYIRQYMETKDDSGGGPVDSVYKRGNRTHVVNFYDSKDAMTVLHRDSHVIAGCQARVFLCDDSSRSVYCAHQKVSSQVQRRKQVVDIPLMDRTAALTTVLVTDIPYDRCFTADSVKVIMNNVGKVKSFQCLEDVYIAIVEFESRDDAMRVVKMKQVTVTTDGFEWLLHVYLLRPLPPEPADIFNTADTAIADMPADQMRCVDWQMVQTNPRAEIQRMESLFQTKLEQMTERMEAQVQAAVEVRVQAEIARMENQFEQALIRMRDQLEAQMAAMIETRIQDVQDHLETQTEARMQAIQVQQETQMEGMVKARVQAIQAQLKTQVEGMVETRVQAEISRLENKQKEQMESRCEAERAHTENTLQRKLGRMKEEMEARLQPLTQVLSRVNELQTEIGSGFSHMQDQFASEVIKLRKELDKTQEQLRREMDETQAGVETQITNDLTQLKEHVTQLETDLARKVRECQESICQTQRSLEIQDRMHTGLMADGQAAVGRQTRAEIVTLIGQITNLWHRLANVEARLSNWALERSGIHLHNPRQESQGREETGLHLSIANGSDSDR